MCFRFCQNGTAKKSNHFTKKDFCFLKKTTNKNPDLEKTLSYCRMVRWGLGEKEEFILEERFGGKI